MEEKYDEISKLEENKTNKTIDEINKQYEIITDTTKTKLDNLPLLSYESFKAIETKSIFNEAIVGRQDTIVSGLIERLGNQDWVKKGLDQYVKENSTCPFCQQETITQDFRDELKKYFDETYEEKIKEIKDLKNSYENLLNGLPSKESFYREDILNKEDSEFEKLKINIEENLKKIKDKIKEPSIEIALKDSQSLFENLNQHIHKKQEEIKEYNGWIENGKKEIENLKNNFWKFIISKYQEDIEQYKKIKNEIKIINEEIKKIDEEIKKINEEIEKKQGSILNIKQAVTHINSDLKDLGITSFSIKIFNEESQQYRIVRKEGERDSQEEFVFKTLSEGEKTLITFLYFIQRCQGKEEGDRGTEKKILVIDDPISSLSFNYVFDIAQFINARFFKKIEQYEQIFISTHHLYFFHELVKNSKKSDMKKFRIHRDENNQSSIKDMEDNEITNDYQAYWQVLKDYRDNGSNKAIVPNVMRNILEHFFWIYGYGGN